MKNKSKISKEKNLDNYSAMDNFLFYKYMGEMGNETQQRGLLNALGIEIKGKLTHLSPKLSGNTQKKKSSRLDIRIQTECGKDINIEAQRQEEKDFIQRLVTYACKRVVQSVTKGGNYKNMKKIISIAICNFNSFKSPLYHNVFKLNTRNLNIKNIYIHEELIDNIEIHFIELPKFRKKEIYEENYDGKIIKIEKDLKNNRKHQYLTFIDEETTHQERKEIVKMGDEGLKESMKCIEIAFENGAFDEYFDNIMEEARQENLMEEREEKGKREGIKEGEEKNKIQIATKLKKMGHSIEDIAEATDLTPETIEKL